MDRKSSDIIVEIEIMVKQILAHVQNQDLLYKTLINRISQMENKTQPQKVEPPIAEIVKTPSKPLMPGLKSGFRRLSKVEEPASEAVSAPAPSLAPEQPAKPQEQPVKPKEQRAVPLRQQVLCADDRVAAMARVEIFDSELSLVKDIKTNNTGNWVSALQPGKYTVKITKKISGKPLETNTEIIVHDSSEPIVLDKIKMG